MHDAQRLCEVAYVAFFYTSRVYLILYVYTALHHTCSRTLHGSRSSKLPSKCSRSRLLPTVVRARCYFIGGDEGISGLR